MFRQRDVGVSNDVAVSLVVDCSGSMRGQKIKTAMEAAFVLCDVLTKIGISNEVVGFSTLGGEELENCYAAIESERLRTESRESVRYSRYEPLYIPIFKGFDERFSTDQKKRIACASEGGRFLRNNVDGESIRLAAKRLLSMTSEKGKQMIVLSDGAPCAEGSYRDIDSDLLKAIGDIEKRGVKVIGIGINDSSVKRYYKNSVVINNVGELPSLIIKELKEVLV